MPGTTVVGDAAVGGALHRMAADGTPDLQTIADVDGIYRFVSAAGLEPFGWTPADLFGRQLLSFTHPDDRRLVEDTHGDAWRDGDTVTTTSRFRCADGRAQGFHFAPPGPGELIEHLVLGTVHPSASTDHRRVARTEEAAHV